MSEREFDAEDLAAYISVDGSAYVAYRGIVYDMSESSLWQNNHQGPACGFCNNAVSAGLQV